jgi:hypothetical protein
LASIQQLSSSVRAVIRRKDFYASRTFQTRELAKQWAAQVEAAYLDAKAKHVVLSAKGLLSQSAHEASKELSTFEPVKVQHLFGLPNEAEICKAGNKVVPSAIYFLIRGEQVVYVGQSVNVHARLGSHFRDDRMMFDRFVIMPCPENLLTPVENYYIGFLNPELNRYGLTEMDVPGIGRIKMSKGATTTRPKAEAIA